MMIVIFSALSILGLVFSVAGLLLMLLDVWGMVYLSSNNRSVPVLCFGGAGLFLFFAILATNLAPNWTDTCLSHGYPRYESGYCIKRVDGTDYVIAVEELE